MHIFNIVDRISSPWTVICPDLNSVCELLGKLNNDPNTESYKITNHEGLHIKEVGKYFGISDTMGRKAI